MGTPWHLGKLPHVIFRSGYKTWKCQPAFPVNGTRVFRFLPTAKWENAYNQRKTSHLEHPSNLTQYAFLFNDRSYSSHWGSHHQFLSKMLMVTFSFTFHLFSHIPNCHFSKLPEGSFTRYFESPGWYTKILPHQWMFCMKICGTGAGQEKWKIKQFFSCFAQIQLKQLICLVQ